MAGIGASEVLGWLPGDYLRQRIKSRTGNSGKSFRWLLATGFDLMPQTPLAWNRPTKPAANTPRDGPLPAQRCYLP
jgi:hypothetical protein